MKSITVADLLHLGIDERLRLVHDLWDSIAADANADPAVLPLTEAQRREIVRRSEAYRANPASAVPLESVLERIERDLG